MPERRLVVTVGTSLFSSASWRAEGRLALVRGYREWTEEPFLENPARRRTEGWRTVVEIEEQLRAAPGDLADEFVWDPEVPKRYPGELTTILRLYEKDGAGETVPEFLRRSYERVELVCPSGQRDSARVAAEHLAMVLENVLEHPGVVLAEELSSSHLADKVEKFARYLENLPDQGIDLLITGGYKSFALQAGMRASGRPPGAWRLLYLHEEHMSDLVIATVGDRGELRQELDGRRVITETVGPV